MSPAQSDQGRYTPTTTHAEWGAGHPRLLVTNDDDRYVHELVGVRTRIGSSTDAELVLTGADALHAEIMHDEDDEYVLTMFGGGEMNAVSRHSVAGESGREETLRTGARFTIGSWRLVFMRDEFADHGRPYGGRQGGEFAHQPRQSPRPDYTGGGSEHSPS
ncbi:hypothetical protein ACTU6U_03900 [Microbacterium sp. A196]|uniref:hypothetical protein n=1 Tax=unclassified Microbacterium TaxID=2609290 RepID=UPI003FD542BB